MNASALRNIWARVMFFKISKLHEPQASAILELEKHHEGPYITKCTSDHTIFIYNILKKFIKKKIKKPRLSLLYGHNSEMASKRFQTAHMFYLNQSITTLSQVNQA